MVYRRTNNKKRIVRKRRQYKKRMPLAKKAYVIAKSLQKKIEYKYFENALGAPVQIDSIGNIYALLYPSQGTSINTRTGDSIKGTILTLHVQFTQYKPLVGSATDETVRLVVLIDKQNSITNVADVLEYNGNSMSVFGSKIQQYRYDSKFLYDKTFNITETRPIVSLKLVIKIPFTVNFAAGLNTVTQNSLKLMAIGQDVALGIGTHFQYISRTTFTDA